MRGLVRPPRPLQRQLYMSRNVTIRSKKLGVKYEARTKAKFVNFGAAATHRPTPRRYENVKKIRVC